MVMLKAQKSKCLHMSPLSIKVVLGCNDYKGKFSINTIWIVNYLDQGYSIIVFSRPYFSTYFGLWTGHLAPSSFSSPNAFIFWNKCFLDVGLDSYIVLTAF